MMDIVAVLLLLSNSAPQATFETDTTFAVAPGSKLRIHDQGGDIVVKAWDKNQVRIQADHSKRSYVEVDVKGQVVEVSGKGRRGMPSLIDYTITVPAWMGLDLGGMYAEISIDGVRGPVKAETLEGNITLRGGGEIVSLETVNGVIDVSGARGRINLHAVSEGITATDIQGELSVESVSGDLDLRGIDAKSVDAQTVSGDIVFSGRIPDGGTYSLLTHSGEITLGLPETANATVSVASANGDVSSTFSIKAERETRRRHTYRLGNGGANIDVETFSGDVEIVRPSEIPARRAERSDHGVRVGKIKVKVGKHRPDQDPDDDDEPNDDEEEDR